MKQNKGNINEYKDNLSLFSAQEIHSGLLDEPSQHEEYSLEFQKEFLENS